MSMQTSNEEASQSDLQRGGSSSVLVTYKLHVRIVEIRV